MIKKIFTILVMFSSVFLFPFDTSAETVDPCAEPCDADYEKCINEPSDSFTRSKEQNDLVNACYDNCMDEQGDTLDVCMKQKQDCWREILDRKNADGTWRCLYNFGTRPFCEEEGKIKCDVSSEKCAEQADLVGESCYDKCDAFANGIKAHTPEFCSEKRAACFARVEMCRKISSYSPRPSLDFEALTCDSSVFGKSNDRSVATAPSYVAKSQSKKTFIPPFISSVSAATDEPLGDIIDLQKEAAYLQQQLAEASNDFRKSAALEDYLLEQFKIAPQSEKESFRQKMSDAYQNRKAFQNVFYEARLKFEKVAEKLAQAEEKESKEKRSAEERRFIDRLIENTERWEKEREDVAVRLKQTAEYAQFQKNKQSGAIPQDICFNNGDCKAGEKREEQFNCAYLSLGSKPVFYKHNPYALSDDDLSGMNSIFSYVGLTSFGAGFAMEPSKKIVIKFLVGAVFEHFAGYPLPLDEGVINDVAANIGQKAFAEVSKLQSKLELVYKIDIPVVITKTEVQETYTSKSDGACHAVEWDKETIPSSGNKEIEIVTFSCEAVSNRTISSREDYDDVFSFRNTAETEAIRTHCLPSEDPQAFAESLKQMSVEALRIVRDRINIANSDQCPKQQI